MLRLPSRGCPETEAGASDGSLVGVARDLLARPVTPASPRTIERRAVGLVLLGGVVDADRAQQLPVDAFLDADDRRDRGLRTRLARLPMSPPVRW